MSTTTEMPITTETPTATEMSTETSRITSADIQRKGAELVRLHRQKKEEYGFIEPEYLLGFREGDCVDLSPYESLGFPHPKPQDYYKISFNDNNEPVGDAEFLKIYESITRSNKIDDPVLIYFYGGQILVLNGITRLSVIGQRRLMQPGFMKRVPYRLFVGEETQARGEMVRLNLDGRQRVIKPREFITMVRHFKNQNMEVGAIRKMITGSTEGNYEINNTITVAFYGCNELVKKLLDKKIPLNVAAEIAMIEDTMEQAKMVESHNEKTTLQQVKLMTRGIAAVVPMIDDIFRRLAKVVEATERLGIYHQCENDFVGIQEHLKTLKNSIAAAERKAADDMGDFAIHDDRSDDIIEDMLHNEDGEFSTNEPDAANEAYMTAEAERSEKTTPPIPKRQKTKTKEKNDEVLKFDINANGSGKLNEKHATRDEVETFVKLWWKEYCSRPVDAAELLAIVEKHDCFKYMNNLPSKKQTRCIFLAKHILSPLAGTKNDINGYYWLRGLRGIKSWWKLERI